MDVRVIATEGAAFGDEVAADGVNARARVTGGGIAEKIASREARQPKLNMSSYLVVCDDAVFYDWGSAVKNTQAELRSHDVETIEARCVGNWRRSGVSPHRVLRRC